MWRGVVLLLLVVLVAFYSWRNEKFSRSTGNVLLFLILLGIVLLAAVTLAGELGLKPMVHEVAKSAEHPMQYAGLP